MGGSCSAMIELEHAYRILAGEPEGTETTWETEA